MKDSTPVSGISLERYARVVAALTGVPAERHGAVLAVEGVAEAQWASASPAWGGRVSSDQALANRYAGLYKAALLERVGGVPDLPWDRLVAANVAARRGSPEPRICEAAGLPVAEFYAASYDWMDRLARDRRLFSLFEVEVQLGLAGHRRKRAKLPDPKPAARVRTRRCPSCGAYKRTEPRTATVYCDWCGSFFDYDVRIALRETGGLALEWVNELLIEGVRGELHEAFEAKDMDAYRAAWRWVYENDMALCPGTWSPRAGDPRYRAAMADWCVETCVAQNFEPGMKDLTRRSQALREKAQRNPSKKSILAYLEESRRGIAEEIEVYVRRGFFDAHPDHLSEADYLRVNLGMQLREFLQLADRSLHADLISAYGFAEEYTEVPPVDMTRTRCGACGNPVLVLAGANRLVCEYCGTTLDLTRPRMPCPVCHAEIVAVTGEKLVCGACDAVFEAT